MIKRIVKDILFSDRNPDKKCYKIDYFVTCTCETLDFNSIERISIALSSFSNIADLRYTTILSSVYERT